MRQLPALMLVLGATALVACGASEETRSSVEEVGVVHLDVTGMT